MPDPYFPIRYVTAMPPDNTIPEDRITPRHIARLMQEAADGAPPPRGWCSGSYDVDVRHEPSLDPELLDLPASYELPPLTGPETGCLLLLGAPSSDSALTGWCLWEQSVAKSLHNVRHEPKRTLAMLRTMAASYDGDSERTDRDGRHG
jgi:hypothetical protein